jgi:hypothetical protein
MSISAPEAHHPQLPDKVVRGAEEYVDGLADLGSILPTDAPAVDKTAEAAYEVIASGSDKNARHRAAERLRALDQAGKVRVVQLARTAIVTSMAGELMAHGHDTNLTPDSRRLAIQLASAALGKHQGRLDRKRNIARHYQ